MTINNLIPNIKTEDYCVIIENYYIKKFGSEEAAQKYFIEKKIHPFDEFNSEVNSTILIKAFKPFSKTKSISDLINNFHSLLNDNTIDKKELYKSLKVLKSLEPEILKVFNLSESRFNVSIIPLLEKKLQLSLSKTREELGYPDQRTFNKWLTVFLGDKFSNHGKRNGSINISEYVEIVSAFMLSYDEDKFNFFDLDNLKYRFEKERSFHKKELKKFTNNNYEILRELLEEVTSSNNINMPEKYRKIPYKIVSLFKSKYKDIRY
jgi:hypothetical protein